MKVQLPADQTAELVAALREAGGLEIGGQLFGEQIAVSSFVVSDLTIQSRLGTFARFVVDLIQAARDAMRFFERTRHNYTRFNYIGEWHSHPSFSVHPSSPDRDTMRELVADAAFTGNFAVMMIVRLDGDAIASEAWVFDPQGNECQIDLEIRHGK